MYLWERPGWPNLTWDERELHALNAQTCRDQGRLLGRMAGLGFQLQEHAHLETAVEDVVKSGAIEGEHLDPEQVRSSVARRLGVDLDTAVSPERHVEGIVEMMLDATANHRQPLTSERLFAWHAALFPTGRSGMRAIRVGTWRGRCPRADAGRLGTHRSRTSPLPGAARRAGRRRNGPFAPLVRNTRRRIRC